jgi:hypothetical protein
MAKQPKIDLEKVLPKKQTAYDPSKQVAGLKKRLGASALPSAKVEDGRNPVERALNLRPNQNVFFDVVEVLDRPRSAIAGAAVAAQQGQDIGKALSEGITGKKFTSWKEYLVNTGLEDREGQIDFADVAGIVMDMVVDPMNIPLWGVSKLAGKAKGVATEAIKLGQDLSVNLKGLDAASDITKVAGFTEKSTKLLDLADRMSTLVKNTMGQEMALALRTAADATDVATFNKAMSAFSTVATSKKTVSTISALGRGLSITASGTIKGADKAITNLLTSLDGLNIRTGGELADDITKFAKEITALDRYTTFKTFVKSVFDKTAVLGDRLVNRVKMTLGKAGYFGEEAKVFTNMYDDVVKSYAKATGKSVEEAATTLMRTFEFSNYTGDFVVGEMLSNKEIMTKVGMNKAELNNVKNALLTLRDFATGKSVYTPKAIDAMFSQVRLSNGVPAYFFKPNQLDDVTKNYKAFRDAIEELAKKMPDSKALSNLVGMSDIFDTAIPKAKFYSATEVAQFQKLQLDGITKSHLDQLDTITNNMYSTVNDRLGFGKEYYQPGKVITPHQQTKETQELFRQFEEFRFLDKKLKGNVKVGAERIYQMSAYEANMMFNANAKNILKNTNLKTIPDRYRTFLQKSSNGQLFAEYINTSFADWLSEAPRTITQSKILADIVITGTFANEDLISATPMQTLETGAVVPRVTPGKINFSKQAFIDKLEEMARYQTNKAPFEEAKKILKAIKGDSLAIDANIFDLIGVNTKGAVGTETFLKIVDEANNAFKKFKLLSPGFHMRNFIGNLFNMIVGGVDPTKALSYQGDVFKIMTNGSDLIEKTVRAGVNLATDDATLLTVLTADELRLFKVLKDYSYANLPKAGRMLWDLPEDVTKLLNQNAGDAKKLKLYEKAFRYNAQANEVVDTYFRLQTFMYARENPEILMRYGLVNPQDLVRRIHFDPTDLSVVEKNFLKRVIPFYTFTKKNLAFQIRNLADNPRLYKQVATLFDGVWKANDIDPYTELEDFKREQFWLPVFREESGKYYALKLNLPLGDLNEFLNNPLQRATSSFTPMIRAPFELAANTQIFSGLPIQEFQGQKAYNLDFLNLVNKIPGFEMFPTRTAEYFISQTGLDVPAALVGGTVKGIADIATGQAGVGELAAKGALQSAVSVGSEERGIRNRQYQELRRLQGLLRYAKQEEILVPTVSEIENKRSPLNTLIKKIRIRGLAK